MSRAIFGWGSSSSPLPPSGSQTRKEAHKVNNSLYELHKPEGTPTTMQVLFFHGLGSGDMSNAHLMTWETEDGTCIWPQEWLPEVFPGLHVITVSYSECTRNFDMYLLGENLILDIIQGGIGQTKNCPVILVGHCVGGLAIKAVCCRADKNRRSNKTGKRDKERLDMFLQNIRGIFYYSTPHHGSSVPQKARAGGLFKFFEILNYEAARLNEEFQDLEISYPKWQMYAVGECLPTTSSKRVEVPEASSRQGAVKFYTVPTADHISICRPSSRTDVRFYHLEGLINMIAAELEEEAKGLEETAGKEAHPQILQCEAHKGLAVEKTILTNDNIYVPIQYSQSELIKAIEEPGEYHVILLHGGVGKGKSTLARCMYEHYGQDEEGENLFEHVFWLSCANCSIQDTSTKQFEILQDHSPHSLLGDFLPKEKSGTKQRISKAYRDFLRGKKILIILDDVSDSRFLYEMWKGAMGAKHVRYLVTSQKSNICNNLKNDSIRIAMGNPTQEEARNILASLVGLDGRVIPDHLQEIADKMIEITEANPLALACLASHFAYSEDNEDKQAWQDAYRDLRKLLDNPEETIVLGNTESTPRSLWAAMKICVDSLETIDTKSILAWIYACKNKLVPEMVLRIWYHSIKKGTFQRSKDELVMKELVKIIWGTMTFDTDMENKAQTDKAQQDYTSWSLRSLVKLYMEVNMIGTKEIGSEIGDLIIGFEEFSLELTMGCKGDTEMEVESEKASVIMTLCALYFDPHHADRTVTGAVTRASSICNIAHSDDDINDLRRKAVEPMIWLLDKPEDEDQWNGPDVRSVRMVLLTYFCKCQFDDENICHLLKLEAYSQAQLATLKAIRQICSVEENPLFGNGASLTFLQVVLHLVGLNDSLTTSVQVAASTALRALCWKALEDGSECRKQLDKPGLSNVLVGSLAVPYPWSDVIPEAPALVLRHVAFCSTANDSLKKMLLQQEGEFVRVVQCLFKHDEPGLQERAAIILANLGGGIKIGDEKGAIHGLLDLLSVENNPDVRADAAGAIKDLSAREDLHVHIANEEGLLSALVKSLTSHSNPGLQENGAEALANLAATESVMMKIVYEEGALDILVKLLSGENKLPRVEEQAARAIGHITQCKALRLTIANHEAAWAGLVKSLTTHDNPGLQRNAAMAMANLAMTCESVAMKIGYQEGVLDSLVKLLYAEDKPKVQEQAARVISVLASQDAFHILIADHEGALVGLITSLTAHENADLQKHAIAALGNLITTESIGIRIGHEEGMLDSLVKLLSAENIPQMQTKAANAIRNLSFWIALHPWITNHEATLAGLVKSLTMRNNPTLQEQSAIAMGNLAMKLESAAIKIGYQEGALDNLVKLLSAEETPEVQEQAARLIGILAFRDPLKIPIANHEGALAGLIKSLTGHNNPGLQGNVAAALANLATAESVKMKIGYEVGALDILVKLLLGEDTLPRVQEHVARVIRNLTGCAALHLPIAQQEGALAGLVKSLTTHSNPAMQEHGAKALANLATTESIKRKIGYEEGALDSLAKLLFEQEKPEVRGYAAFAVSSIATTEDNTLKLRIVQIERALPGLVQCLPQQDQPNLQLAIVLALCSLAEFEQAKAILQGTTDILKVLTSLLADDIPRATQFSGAPASTTLLADDIPRLIQWKGAFALTLINPTAGQEARLTSADAYRGRVNAFISMGMYTEALPGLDEAIDLVPGADTLLRSLRCFVRAKLGDLEGALEDADEAIKVSNTNDKSFKLQERGVLKQMLGDLKGALADLDEGLTLDTPDYEILKHRGFVKFLLNDEEGAKADAEWALRIKPPSVDRHNYGKGGCLGVSPVEYLGYKLK